MQIGDLVQHWLTEQVGIVINVHDRVDCQVLWTAEGPHGPHFPAGKEWVSPRSLETLNASR